MLVNIMPHSVENLWDSFAFFLLPADNRGALRDLEGLEKLVEFVGNKVSVENTFVKLRK